jgi:hypothetical protein
VIRCLQDAREELSYECRATLFDAEVRMAEDIDFKYPMKRACTAEIQGFCAGVQHGHARVRGLTLPPWLPCSVIRMLLTCNFWTSHQRYMSHAAQPHSDDLGCWDSS